MLYNNANKIQTNNLLPGKTSQMMIFVINRFLIKYRMLIMLNILYFDLIKLGMFKVLWSAYIIYFNCILKLKIQSIATHASSIRVVQLTFPVNVTIEQYKNVLPIDTSLNLGY